MKFMIIISLFIVWVPTVSSLESPATSTEPVTVPSSLINLDGHHHPASFVNDVAQQQAVADSAIVDDCCCHVSDVITGNEEIHAILNKMSKTKYFSLFKVDLYNECPFWATNFLCEASGGSCGICECDEGEIPLPWRTEKTDLVKTVAEPYACWPGSEEDIWTPKVAESDMVYLDLLSFPERNTGYVNDSTRIWKAIYDENCFPGAIESACFEERALYRLISGLHTSISTHIAAYYVPIPGETGKTIWTPHYGEFMRRIGSHPERIKNLYFVYLFVLRAIHKAEPLLLQMEYTTGNATEEALIAESMKELLKSRLLCNPNFDENGLFDAVEKTELKRQFAKYIRNITQMMDCVACEQCEVWGKLQLLGIGTSLKVLMTDKQSGTSQSAHLQIKRNEIVALVNTLRQLSHSIALVERLKANMENVSLVISKPRMPIHK